MNYNKIMIRQKSTKKRVYARDKGESSDRHLSEYIFFSDAAGLPTASHRFVGQGNSAIVVNDMEDAFLQVTCVIGRPTLISSITATIKQAETSFEDIAFDLIRISSTNGPINMLGDSVVMHVTVPGREVFTKNTVYSQSATFSPILLNTNDLIAIRVDPGEANQCAFYAAITIQ